MDADRLATLFDAHAAALALYARQWLDRAAAEDVVQEAYVRLMLQTSEPDNAKAWLFRTARNEAISQTRSRLRRSRREQSEMRPPWFEPSNGASIDAAQAKAAMQTLPVLQREVIVLRIWAGMTLKDIATMVELPVSSVFDQYRQGIAKIREQMGEICLIKLK